MSRLVWADPIEVTIGGWHVGVRADSARTADRLARLLRAYVTGSGMPLRSNFSLRAPAGRLRKRPGAVYLGGVLVAESTSFDELSAVVVRLLSGLQQVTAPCTHVELRAFVAGDRAVLLDGRMAGVEHAAALIDLGAVEVVAWQPVVDTATAELVVMATMPHVDVPGLEPSGERRYGIRGLVTTSVHDARIDTGSLWARATEDRGGWLELLRRFDADGRLLGVEMGPPDELGAALAALLAG